MTNDTEPRFRQEHFQRVTGLSKDQIGNLIKRGHLPFHNPDAPGWSTYTYRQAYATRMVVALIEAGVEPYPARWYLEECFDLFASTFGEQMLAGKQILFGKGAYHTETMPHVYPAGLLVRPHRGTSPKPIAGPLNDLHIFNYFENLSDPKTGFQSAANLGVSFATLSLIDATDMLRPFIDWAGDTGTSLAWLREAISDA